MTLQRCRALFYILEQFSAACPVSLRARRLVSLQGRLHRYAMEACSARIDRSPIARQSGTQYHYWNRAGGPLRGHIHRASRDGTCSARIDPYTVFALAPRAISLIIALVGAFTTSLMAGNLPNLPFYIAHKEQTTLYLLGTLHVGKASDYPPPVRFRPAIRSALDASSVLAFEISPDDLILAQDDVLRYGICTYSCLPRLLPAALWQRLAVRLRDSSAASAFAEIRKNRPWLAALRIDAFAARAAGLHTEYGTEVQLENIYARGRIIGLETLNEHILAFACLTRAEQSEMLAQSLAPTLEQSTAEMRKLHDLWRAGDADQLAVWQANTSEKWAHSRSVSKAIDEKTLCQRNRRFIARILLIAEPSQPLFVAIGALHLGGPRGVLALLRQHGFDVQPG